MTTHPITAEEMRALIAAALPAWALEHTPGMTFAVACSGGPDSLALTIRAAEAFPGRVHALIVDHGLRAGSAAEAAQTKAWLAARNIPSDILRWQGAKPAAGLQAAARAARYTLLRDACGRLQTSLLFLAHHLDDQAETFLLALGRKAGLQGLAGMTAFRHEAGLNFVRPLLSVPKTRLVATLAAMAQDHISDPSNEDDRFDRARLRAQMQALAEAGLTPELLAGAATRLADARDLMQDLRQTLWQQVTPAAAGIGLPLAAIAPMLASLPGQRCLLVPLLGDMIGQVSGAKPRFDELERVIGWVAAGSTGSRTLGHCRISIADGLLLVRPAS